MTIILGGTGHVGSALAQILLRSGEPVTIVSRTLKNADAWKQKGAVVKVADVYNTKALHQVFLTGQRLFLLNPPAAPSTDTVAEEHKTLQSILHALQDTSIKKVVAESTYGAQPGVGHGDLNVLYDMEQALQKTGTSTSIIRAAYYMSNWDVYLPMVQKGGKLPTLFPADYKIPMVSPADIGKVAARLIKEPVEYSGLQYVEGPETYSPADVANAFAKALQKPVEVVSTPRSQWKAALKATGFSDAAAESYSAMTGVVLDQSFEKPEVPVRGATTIDQYIAGMVKRTEEKDKTN